MANYGDVALTLGRDWSRRKLHDQKFALGTVGHEDGKADAYLKDDPDKEHNFAWVEPKYQDEVSINQSKGYAFCKKAEGWEKNPNLWEWTAEGFIRRFDGQLLMARSKERFLEDMAERKVQRDRVMNVNRDDEEAERIAQRAGIEISGTDRPRIKRKGLRN